MTTGYKNFRDLKRRRKRNDFVTKNAFVTRENRGKAVRVEHIFRFQQNLFSYCTFPGQSALPKLFTSRFESGRCFFGAGGCIFHLKFSLFHFFLLQPVSLPEVEDCDLGGQMRKRLVVVEPNIYLLANLNVNKMGSISSFLLYFPCPVFSCPGPQ